MGRTIRILSANLWSGAADPDAFAELVVALKADVVAVQELSHEQAVALSQVMPHGELEPAHRFVGSGIVARRPGETSRLGFADHRPWVMRLEPGVWPQLASPIEVVGIHFCAPHAFRTGLGVLRRRRQARAFEASEACVSEGERCHRRILVGDFNSTPLWPLYRRVARHYQDAALLVARRGGGRAARTWGPLPSSPRLFRIDHAFVRGLEVEAFQVVPVRGSDHSAVVVDLCAELPA